MAECGTKGMTSASEEGPMVRGSRAEPRKLER